MAELTPAPPSPPGEGREQPVNARAPIMLGPLRKNTRGAVIDLKARLYDRPENCQVLQTVKKQELLTRQNQAKPVIPPVGQAVPRPPSGNRSKAPSMAFRTTMFKRDFERKALMKKGKEAEDDTMQILSRFHHRRRSQDSVSDRGDIPPEGAEKDDELLSVTSEDTRSLVNENIAESVKSVKTVTFTTSEVPPLPLQYAASPDELPPLPQAPPIKPLSPIQSPHASPTGRTGSATSQSQSRVSQSQQDPGLVLSYMQKNIYDDEKPENDNFIEVLKEMRKKLGWNTEIPRHGQGCKEAMSKLTDKPDPKQGVEIEQLAALAAKDDDGLFVYAVPRNRKDKRGRYNPYDLQVVSAQIARSYTTYWTASASNVTFVEQSGGTEESERTPVLQWLWEHRLFSMIHDIPVFVKFRKWKAFTTWRWNVRGQKNTGTNMVLTRTLFGANEVLQGCLLHVRGLCEAASGSLTGLGEGQEAIVFVNLDKSTTYTLEDFMNAQKSQIDKSLEQLMVLRRKVVDLVWEACATVAEMEGVTHGIRPDHVVEARLREQEKKDKQTASQDVKKDARFRLKAKYGLLSPTDKKQTPPATPIKKRKPTYAQISEWRKILKRLSHFLRLVDYVVLEMLRRLVITATKHLLKFVSVSYYAGAEDDEEDSETQSQSGDEDDGAFLHGKQLASPRQSPSKLSFHSQSTSRSATHRTSSGLGRPLQPGTKYVIPKFDFDKHEEEEKKVDIDEVLEEIEHQNDVVEIPSAMVSIQLVLNVPAPPPVQPTPAKTSRGEKRRSRADMLSSQPTNQRRKSVTIRKSVKFTETSSSDSSEYDSDYDSEEGRAEEKDTTEAEMKRNRFAYEEGGRLGSVTSAPKAYITLSPSEDTVKRSIRMIISNFEHTIAQVGSLLHEPKLSVFYSPPKYDLQLNYDLEMKELEGGGEENAWPSIEQLFGGDPEYQTLISEIMDYISNAMEEVKDFSKLFEQFCDMVDKAQRVNVEESMDKRHWSTEEFNHVLAAHTDQIYQMNHMILHRRLGLIDVLCQNFRQSCLPYPTSILDAVHKKMPIIALKRNEDLLTIIKGASKKLDKFPNSVEEFVEHLSFLGKMSSEMPALEKEYAIVTKMYTIAKDFEMKIHPEDLALYQTLAPSFQHLKTTILYAEAKKDDNIRKFSTDLDTLIHNIRYKIMDIKNRVIDPMLLNSDTMAMMALEKINYLTEEVTELSTKARSYANYQERFGSSLTQSRRNISEEFLLMDRKESDSSAQEIQTDLSEIERDLTLRRLLWESQDEWDRLESDWTTSTFDMLNVESLQKNVNRFTQTVYMLEKGLPHNEVVPRIKEKVVDFKQVMPCVTSLRNPSLKSRHYDQIEKIIGKAIARDKNFTLGNLLEMNIIKHKDKIQDISTTASNEATLERMLQKVVDLWKVTDFRLVPHASGSVVIISGADDILAQLEESQVTIGTIRGSRYVTPIKSMVEEWERKLQLFARTLDEWMTCQRNWLYLEQIFTTPDIQRQLPNESKLFGQVDKAWKDIMRRTEDRPNSLRSATAPGVLEMLQSANSNLEKIQKCLEDYLETKRLVFPRFYFLSNDDLLDILAQSKNPEAVQNLDNFQLKVLAQWERLKPHLGKCFGNIKSLEIKILPRQPPTVKTITSHEKETIPMPKNVRARGPVEQWLGSVEMGMFDTVKKHLKMGLQDFVGIGLEQWVMKHPGQVVLTVSQIMFNKDVTQCFNQYEALPALSQLRDKMLKTLTILAHLVTSPLQSHKLKSITAFLTIQVHNRDILNSMCENKITRKDDFEWTRQLRYEWDEQSNNCNVMQSNASVVYGYEYLGCSPRLVITPLTDRCYLTLTGALHLHLGGSPAGPAGTGKTETVKDLAKAMGKQCVVFNCSEGLDYKMLGKFFSGMAQSGCWCCFDEFNRIDLEVLSVVAMQIHTIKTAKDQLAPRFVFEGHDIRLNMTCAAFITMNPSYAGRVELPDNLKSLFRQVAMMVPDYALIAEIMLFSEGFTAAKSLSTKIVNLYDLASKQLSQQDHYDFGMRAIKSVLLMAGQRKRQSQLGSGAETSENEESFILIHALRDANMPKFLAEDVPLFESILADLFPGITPPQQDQGILEKAISIAIRDQGLQHWPSQIEKVKQFHSQILVRHGVMLVGPTGGGKSVSRNILQRALVLLPTLSMDDLDNPGGGTGRRKQSVFVSNRAKKGHVETFTVNPKCVTLGELYGETDPLTFEWTDGLIATATRRFARDSSTPSPDESTRPQSGITAISATTGAMSFPSSGAPSSRSSTPAAESEMGEVPPSEDSSELPTGEGQMDTVPVSWKWIILDGPVDTIWVENLNTVLDDSKILCLANAERINLTPGMRLIFEVDDLSQASPATISRCAMVYMDPVDLGWRPYVKTWLQRLPRDIPESGKQHLNNLFDHSIEKGLKFVRQYAKFQMLPTPELSIINCLCNLLAAFFDFMAKNGGFGNPDKEPVRPPSGDSESGHSRNSSRPGSRTEKKVKGKRVTKKQVKLKEELQSIAEKASAKLSATQNSKQYFLQRNPGQLTVLLGKLYVFAFTWSFGGNFRRQDELDDDGGIGRKGGDRRDLVDVDIATEFDNFVHELFECEPPIGVRMPASSRTIYSYFVDMDSGNFLLWDALVATTQSLIEKGAMITIGETMGVSSEQQHRQNQEGEIVPTVDTVRYTFLSSLLLLSKNSVLLTGESGVGKTAVVKHMLKKLSQEGGTSYKNGTILGNIFNFTDKNAALLENISSLTRFNEDGGGEKNLDVLLGTGRMRQATGITSSLLQFSAQTTSHRTQLALTHKLIKKGRDIMGAPKGKKVLVFVDDFNMPAQEQYGAQPPLELLRQFMDMGGFYDTRKLVWKDILDVTVIGACGPPGGGRNPVSPRLLKHFCMLALPQPSTRSLQHIYQVQLGRFFNEFDFMPEVKECLFPLVSASIAIYYSMIGAMRPTPAKIHYTFNIRDLSQVITGLLQAEEFVIVNSDNCAQLFAHEASRVFHDRLVDDQDRAVFYQMLADNLHDYFKVKWTPEKVGLEPVLFADFLDEQTSGTKPRVYRPINDRAKLTSILEEYYMRQNIGNTQMKDAPQLVFFKDAVEHILRAARVFRQPGGHMLMVGLDGTGKSTTVQLAAYIASCELYKLLLTRGYNFLDFRDDLKKVCLMAGVKGLNTVFLLTDGDIVKESFLEDVNCILNSGEVPDLFDNEEMDGIALDLKSAAAESQIPDTRIDVYQFFIQRVKKNLHIVLTMSPAGTKFRQRCRMNPSLINCCTIDWYDEWNREASLSVAHVYFQNADFICEPDQDVEPLKRYKRNEELKTRVAEVCVDIHVMVAKTTSLFWEEMRRRYYVTPSSYMELIRIYSKMLNDQKTQFMNNRDRLLVGLSRLSEANSLVGTMQEELVALGPKIEEKARDTEMLLAQLEKDQEAVDQVREIVEAEETVMKKETQVVQDYADECQRDLASVLPVLQKAIESLDSLDKADIAEIRVYARPPELVMTVMSAVCVLLEEKPDWATAKQVLGDQQFLKRLIAFDKNAVPEKVFNKLKKYSKHPDFTPEIVGQVSAACKSMCQWVIALEHYHEVYKMAKPKQKRVEEAKDALQLAKKNLSQKQASLAKIQEHLSMLQQQYQDSVNQREGLKERKKLTALRLQRASVLITALSDEKVRWAESVDELDFKLRGLVGDMVISAGAVAYLGAFTSKYRHNLITAWVNNCSQVGIPISQGYELVKSVASPNQVLLWQNEGLPNDTHSTENAIIVKKGRKWPLLIDPQGQASNWIHEMEGAKLKMVQAGDPNYMRTMERAIRVGEPVLLQDVTEDLDPSLKPILSQETTIRGGHHVIKLGDTEIEYNHNFKLYLTTAMSNPHFLPVVCINVTVINFTVTFDGLQEQLLSSVVKQERPKLERERSQLLNSIASDLQLLRDLEDKTLGLLQESQGHILDDQDLVETLQMSKGKSEEIHKRVDQSEETEKKLNQARKRYLPVATRGAVLYFVLADLANVDVMYQFSLPWFQDMFTTCIKPIHPEVRRPVIGQLGQRRLSGAIRPPSARRSSDLTSDTSDLDPNDLSIHMQKMIDRLTWSLYRIVSVALFADHQLMFSFLLCSSILRANTQYGDHNTQKQGVIHTDEWTVFLQGSIMASMMDEKVLQEHDGLSPLQRLEYQTKEKKPKRLKWITDTMWRQCQHLEATFEAFSLLCRSIINVPEQWELFNMSSDPFHFLGQKWDDSKFAEDSDNKSNRSGKSSGSGSGGSTRVVFPWEELTCFQRLLVIKVLRLSMLTASVRIFVQEQMGQKFVSHGAIDLKEMFEESSARCPLIFILSSGSDPGAQLLRFAKELRGSTLHLDMISLGRGQGPRAEELIAKAQILKGRWLFLQNCHLAASWMPRLQAIVDSFNKPDADVDPQFRLWLSSKPDPNFPISILQSGLKMTVEPPKGVKANLQRSFSTHVSERSYEEILPEKPAWKNLLFGLCFFNAVIHERKKYGRLGWNIVYEFNDSDLEVSILQLEMLLTEQEEIPWPALWYLTGEVTFGGRVTDDWDRRCLHRLLQKFYHPRALKPDYIYSPDKVYHPLPSNYRHVHVKSYIDSLPASDSPELFGMNENAETAYLELQAGDLLETILSVQPRVSKGLIGSSKSSDDVVLDMAEDMLKKIPEKVEQEEEETGNNRSSQARPTLVNIINIASGTYFKTHAHKDRSAKREKVLVTEDNVSSIEQIKSICSSALFTVLRQEIDRFNNLLVVIHKSLKALRRAVKGEVVMSQTLEESYNALLNQRVPAEWKSMSYESCKHLSAWVSDLIMRVDFFSEWCELVTRAADKALKVQLVSDNPRYQSSNQPQAPPPDTPPEEVLLNKIQPRSFWLSAFFFPQGFLTAVSQNHARKLGVSVDSLHFEFEIVPSPLETSDTLNDVKQTIDIKELGFKSGSSVPEDGVLVFGLYIDGGQWDLEQRVLVDSQPGNRFCRLPEIRFIPSTEVSRPSTASALESPMAMFKTRDYDENKQVRDVYECPLYRTSSRAGTLSSTGISTNFVTSVSLPTNQSPEFWVMRGIALLCQLDD